MIDLIVSVKESVVTYIQALLLLQMVVFAVNHLQVRVRNILSPVHAIMVNHVSWGCRMVKKHWNPYGRKP